MPPGAVQRFCGLLSELLGVKLGHQRLAVQAGIGALGAPEKPANEIQQALLTPPRQKFSITAMAMQMLCFGEQRHQSGQRVGATPQKWFGTARSKSDWTDKG